MGQLLRLVLEISALRAPPQALPASLSLTALLLTAHAASGAALARALPPPQPASAYALLETALMAGALYALLAVTGKRARLPQSLSALAGTGTVVNLAALPVFATLAPGAQTSLFAALAVLVLLGWSFAIAAHVLRHTLSASWAEGAMIALAYFILSYLALGAAFPAGD